MVDKKTQKRKFNGMSYHEVQRANSENRAKLNREDQKWLRDNGYKNVGWAHVISLYQKIEELLEKNEFKELTLEELFLEADRIGNKYLTNQEITEFNQILSKELTEVEQEIEKQFPDTEIEVIDYSNQSKNKVRNQKSYRTVRSS